MSWPFVRLRVAMRPSESGPAAQIGKLPPLVQRAASGARPEIDCHWRVVSSPAD